MKLSRAGSLYPQCCSKSRWSSGATADGRAFALRDACPHRGMPLSCGSFDGQQVECSYHGWKFNAHSGQCSLIPSLTSDQPFKIDRIYAGSFPCEERDAFIWVYIPEPGPPGAGFTKRDDAPMPAPRVPTFSDKYKIAYLTADLPCNVDHGIIGLMDPAHGPFVHQAWWWRTRHSIHEKRKNFEPIPNGFRMSAHTPSSNSAPYKLLRMYADASSITTTIDFVLPNLRSEIIQAGKYWFASLTTVTPITRNRCRIDVVAAWNLFRWLPVRAQPLEVCLRKICRAGPPHHGTAIRRTQTQSAPDAHRRRRPSRKMVFRAEASHTRLPPHRRRDEESAHRPSRTEMAKLVGAHSAKPAANFLVKPPKSAISAQHIHSIENIKFVSMSHFPYSD